MIRTDINYILLLYFVNLHYLNIISATQEFYDWKYVEYEYEISFYDFYPKLLVYL
jgi:hypothetical protein